MSKLWVKEVVVVLALLMLSACSKAAAPSDDDMKAFLVGQAPQNFELSLEKIEPFIDSDTAEGRVSVAATLTVAEDLFVTLDKREVAAAYAALGVPQDHLEFISSLQPDPVYLRRTQSKGTRFPFTLDVQARKDVGRWSFITDQGVEQAAGLTVSGSLRGTFPQDAAILDDASSPQVKQVLALSKEIAAADAKVMASFEKSFSAGKPMTLRFWQVDKPRFAIRNDKPFSMTFTAATPVVQVPLSGIKPAHLSVEGPVVFRGTPSDFAGRLLGEGKFYPWRKIRLDGTLERYGKPGAIKTAINLQLYQLDDYETAQFHRFDGSEAYFVDGRVRTYDKDTYYNWRWAE